ncbi:MAG: tRNA 2-thiouridine(34) synthase MnmA [Candidatus Kapabacteria bacterium]|nr:tRNA 2-thiouridine(34) synthase MnmA [Ignavibacteriota bacterium]MCW5883507.1 tRNA 2-thiouridine(34) synthase MnmA [Candidatus Kapabacteria bacterium]
MKVAVLLSGGVDSSVALCLLKEQGYDVTAFYLKIWLEDELAFLGECPWEEDLKYARSVCDSLGVKLEIINMQAEYLNTVVEYTISELKAGRTPSPDIMCNRHIKFGQFFGKIDSSYEKVASGHYAQIEENNRKFYLKESPDAVKDQTYFLTYLNQEQLSKIIFPIGKFTKPQVRELANRFALPTSGRKDSQGICFLGKIKYNDFIKFHLGELEGEIREIETNKILGNHKGYWFHTIGQRTGLGLSGGPWYVVRKNIENNIIYVSRDNQTEKIPHNIFNSRDVNWIPESPEAINLKVKLRHGPVKNDCSIDYISNGKVRVNLATPDQGISAGQFSIFYKDGYCLGGGVIEQVGN